MRKLHTLSLALTLLLAAHAPARAHASLRAPADLLAKVGFEQVLGAKVPLDLMFRDARGAAFRFGTALDDRPTLLVPGYYGCSNLCDVVRAGVAHAVEGSGFVVGQQFNVVLVSIDPHETPAQALLAQEHDDLAHPGAQVARWRYLTGTPDTSAALTRAIGFRYYFDARNGQYDHPAGIVVLSPQGVATQYLLGVQFAPQTLRLALVSASRGHLGNLVDRFVLLCCDYDPSTGRYSLLISRVMQGLGILTVLTLVGLIASLRYRDLRRGATGETVMNGFHMFIPEASSGASRIDALFWSMIVLCGLVAIGVFGAMLFYCVRYHRGSMADRTGRHNQSLGVELTWSLVPFALFIGVFGWSLVLFAQARTPPADAQTIYIVAKQWMWTVQHPAGQREINTLHVPLGLPIRLTMTSQDVIHSFYVPAFRVKQDVLPGRYTQLWFTATRLGTFPLFCAEYCGLDHSKMGGAVVVMSPADYAQWLTGHDTGESLAALGAALFRSRGCSGCHGPNASIHAPDLEDLYGRSVHLSDGSTVIADERYLHDSILLPNIQIVAGYAPIMPSFTGQLSEEDLLALIAYLKSLSPGTNTEDSYERR